MKVAVKLLLLFLIVCSLPAFAESREKVNDRLNDAARDLDELANAPDYGIPANIMSGAKCIAIIPSLVKAGFIFGAEGGRGVATCRVNHRWSAPAFFTLAGGSWGAQIGISGTDLVMLFMSDEGARHLLSANWKIGADVGIAAGPWGRESSANTAVNMSTGILTYSRSRGLFIGAALNGANVHADGDAIRAFYGRDYNFRDLLRGTIAPPPAAEPFLHQVRHSFHEAREER